MPEASDLLRSASAAPDKLAMSVVSLARAERWSFARLNAAIRGAATGLQGLARPGDRVQIALPLGSALPIAYLAADLAGLRPMLDDAPDGQAPAVRITPGPANPSPSLRQITARDLLAMAELPLLPVPEAASPPEPSAPELLASDRVMLIGTLPAGLSLRLGVLRPWRVGATALLPAPGTAAGQVPLLAARHGATVLIGPAAGFQDLLARDWRAIASLRLALVTEAEHDPRLAADWQQRTGCPMQALAPGHLAG